MDVVVVVPVLGRPQRVEPLLTSLWEATPEAHRVLFVANVDDHDELAAVRAAGADLLTVSGAGTYPQKINAAYRETSEPLMFLAADDLSFHIGWLSAACSMLTEGVSVVGTNDLGNERVTRGIHSTHTLVARTYCDHPGATSDRPRSVLHEGYQHWYCDDELVGVAAHRGAYAHATDSVVEHLHPYHGKAEMDETYRLGEAHRRQDRREFQRRRRRWT